MTGPHYLCSIRQQIIKSSSKHTPEGIGHFAHEQRMQERRCSVMVLKQEDAWMVLSGFLAPSLPPPWVCAKQTERGISPLQPPVAAPPGRASGIALPPPLLPPALETILREREAWKVRGHCSESQLCHEDRSPRLPTSPACSGNSNLSKEDCSDLDQRWTYPQCPAQRLPGRHISRDPNCYGCAQDCNSDLKQPRAKLGRGQFVFRAAGTYISVCSFPLWAPHSQEPTLHRWAST